MKCNIILHEEHRKGIIGKMADRLVAGVRAAGCDAEITARPDREANINHYMDFLAVNPILPGTKNTVFITHADDAIKVKQTLQTLRYIDAGICMSRMTVKFLLDAGADASKLCYVLPAHDGVLQPRRIKIGLTTHLYPDGRKREDLLVRLGRDIGLSDIEFEIFGLRWEKTADKLRECGAVVNLHTGEGDYEKAYDEMIRAIPSFDYYLYMGLDEGSMGTLDALAAGVPLIVTKEGFHMDLPLPPEFPFIDYDELRNAVVAIREERMRRVDAVRCLTWEEYAKRHVMIWRSLHSGTGASLPEILGQQNLRHEMIDGYVPFGGKKKMTYYLRSLESDRLGRMRSYYFYLIKGKFVAQIRRVARLLRIAKREGVWTLIGKARGRWSPPAGEEKFRD